MKEVLHNCLKAVMGMLILSVFFGLTSLAQQPPTPPAQGGPSGWTDDGTVVRLTNSNDNVGIGTNSPSSKLEISGGNLKVSGTLIAGAGLTTTGGDVEISFGNQLNFFSSSGATTNIGLESLAPGKLTVGSAILDVNSVIGERSFSFPNQDGTFALLEGTQTFTGFKKFISSANSTVQIGDSTKTACLAMGDSDGVGITYITANDGVLTATTTKPSICQ